LIEGHAGRISNRFDGSAIVKRDIGDVGRMVDERDALVLGVLLDLVLVNRRIENVRVSDRGGDAVVGRRVEHHVLVEELAFAHANAVRISTISPISFVPVAFRDDERRVGDHLVVQFSGVEHADVDDEVADVIGIGIVSSLATGVTCPMVGVVQQDWRWCSSAGAHDRAAENRSADRCR